MAETRMRTWFIHWHTNCDANHVIGLCCTFGGGGVCLFQTAAHLSPGCLREGFSHPLKLMQHNLQVLPLLRPLRSLRAVEVTRQREQKLKNGPHFLLHLGGTGQKGGGISLQPHNGNCLEERSVHWAQQLLMREEQRGQRGLWFHHVGAEAHIYSISEPRRWGGNDNTFTVRTNNHNKRERRP